jgi:hypothetical protein
MNPAQPNLNAPLRLHPLTYLDEGDDVTLGRADIDSYGLFPPDGAALLQQLEAGTLRPMPRRGTGNSAERTWPSRSFLRSFTSSI